MLVRHSLPAAVFAAFLLTHALVRLWPGKRRLPAQDAGDWLYRALQITTIGLFHVALPLAALLTPWLSRFDFAAPSVFAWLSIPVFADSIWTYWLSHTGWGGPVLSREGSMLTQQPKFASLWIWTVAQSLCVPNCVGGVGCLAAFGFLFFLRTLKPLMVSAAPIPRRRAYGALAERELLRRRERTEIPRFAEETV